MIYLWWIKKRSLMIFSQILLKHLLPTPVTFLNNQIPSYTSLKSTIETLEKGVKYDDSNAALVPLLLTLYIFHNFF